MIRIDFVSNSSSSSFMLVGDHYYMDEIIRTWLRLHPEDEDMLTNESSECYDEDAQYDIPDKLATELGLTVCCGIYEYSDEYVFGLSFEDMKNDETKQDFINRIKDKLMIKFDHANVCAIVDGGMDA